MPVAPFQYGVMVVPGAHFDWSGRTLVGGNMRNCAYMTAPNEEIMHEWAETAADDPLDGWSPVSSAVAVPYFPMHEENHLHAYYHECSWVRGHAYRQDIAFLPVGLVPGCVETLKASCSDENVEQCKELTQKWLLAVKKLAAARAQLFEDAEAKSRYLEAVDSRIKTERERIAWLPQIQQHQLKVIEEHSGIHNNPRATASTSSFRVNIRPSTSAGSSVTRAL